MTDDGIGLIRLAVDACVEAGARYAVIGGIARNVWAPPRATTDADITVAVDLESWTRLKALLERRGLTVRREISAEGGAGTPDLLLLERPDGEVRRLDVLVAGTAFEREAIDEAVTVDLRGPCRVVRPEHLIVYKLIAGRPRDRIDAEDVARTREIAGDPVDFDVVRRWAAEWGVDDRLEELLRTLA